jgi:hypothetical protein
MRNLLLLVALLGLTGCMKVSDLASGAEDRAVREERIKQINIATELIAATGNFDKVRPIGTNMPVISNCSATVSSARTARPS